MRARSSGVVFGLTCSSVSNTNSPWRVLLRHEQPSVMASPARRGDSGAQASCSARPMPHLAARVSAVILDELLRELTIDEELSETHLSPKGHREKALFVRP